MSKVACHGILPELNYDVFGNFNNNIQTPASREGTKAAKTGRAATIPATDKGKKWRDRIQARKEKERQQSQRTLLQKQRKLSPQQKQEAEAETTTVPSPESGTEQALGTTGTGEVVAEIPEGAPTPVAGSAVASNDGEKKQGGAEPSAATESDAAPVDATTADATTSTATTIAATTASDNGGSTSDKTPPENPPPSLEPDAIAQETASTTTGPSEQNEEDEKDQSLHENARTPPSDGVAAGESLGADDNNNGGGTRESSPCSASAGSIPVESTEKDVDSSRDSETLDAKTRKNENDINGDVGGGGVGVGGVGGGSDEACDRDNDCDNDSFFTAGGGENATDRDATNPNESSDSIIGTHHDYNISINVNNNYNINDDTGSVRSFVTATSEESAASAPEEETETPDRNGGVVVDIDRVASSAAPTKRAVRLPSSGRKDSENHTEKVCIETILDSSSLQAAESSPTSSLESPVLSEVTVLVYGHDDALRLGDDDRYGYGLLAADAPEKKNYFCCSFSWFGGSETKAKTKVENDNNSTSDATGVSLVPTQVSSSKSSNNGSNGKSFAKGHPWYVIPKTFWEEENKNSDNDHDNTGDHSSVCVEQGDGNANQNKSDDALFSRLKIMEEWSRRQLHQHDVVSNHVMEMVHFPTTLQNDSIVLID